MKRTARLCLAAALGSSMVAGYVSVDFTKSKGSSYRESQIGIKSPHLTQFINEDGELEVVLTNNMNFYSLPLEIGTPPQEVMVLLDTGSSDLWVSSSTNPFCASNSTLEEEIKVINLTALTRSTFEPVTTIDEYPVMPTMDCQEYGVFDPSNSSTYKKNESDIFSITYADNSFAEGVWGYDQLTLNGLNISNLKFAVASLSNTSVGVLGIGLEELESGYYYTGSGDEKYPNFPAVLKENGAIEKIAYSLYLNDLSADSGTILFGGVDHSKYTGSLYTYPLIDIYEDLNQPAEFDVTVQGIGMRTKSKCRQQTLGSVKFPGLLDSGTTLLYLDSSIVDEMAEYLNGTWKDEWGIYFLKCPSDDDDTEIIYDFGGLQISTPIKNYIMTTDDVDTCALGAIPSDQHAILGDIFLSSAYVVYDLENLEVSIAQANFEVGDEDIEDIISTIPGAQPGPGYNNTWVSPPYAVTNVTSELFPSTSYCEVSKTTVKTSHITNTVSSSVASLTYSSSAKATSSATSSVSKAGSPSFEISGLGLFSSFATFVTAALIMIS